MMTSCWKGLGNFLGECVPHSEVPNRAPTSSRHVGPTPSSPPLSRSSTGVTIMNSMRSSSVRPDPRTTRYLVVRPASPRQSTSPFRAGSRSRRNTTTSVVDRNDPLYRTRRISDGDQPLVLLPRSLQLPSIEGTSLIYSYGKWNS